MFHSGFGTSDKMKWWHRIWSQLDQNFEKEKSKPPQCHRFNFINSFIHTFPPHCLWLYVKTVEAGGSRFHPLLHCHLYCVTVFIWLWNWNWDSHYTPRNFNEVPINCCHTRVGFQKLCFYWKCNLITSKKLFHCSPSSKFFYSETFKTK